MTRTEHLLCCLAEECAEVAQRASKALRFGLHDVQPGQPLNNEERLRVEATDLIGVLELLALEGIDLFPVNSAGIERKKAQVEEYLQYSASCGTLQG